MGILRDDAAAMVTGFGSVLVIAESGETRGLWTEIDTDLDVGRFSAIGNLRALLLSSAAVASLALAREDTLEIGAVEDDDATTAYTVVDLRATFDGLTTQVLVVAS